jgi:hypothetical protein
MRMSTPGQLLFSALHRTISRAKQIALWVWRQRKELT